MSDYSLKHSWKQAFKDAPAYLANGISESWAWWKKAHPILWVLQIIYLILLVTTFWFVVTYSVSILENDVMPAKSSIDFWWIMLTPITQVGTLFLLWGICGKFAKFVINKFNIPNPDEQ